MTNFFDAELLIKQRLADKVDSIPDGHILSACDIEAVKHSSHVRPSISVIYRGDKIVSVLPTGVSARVSQNWQIVVAAQNLASDGSGTGITDAGLIIQEMLEALMGYRLSGIGGKHGELMLVAAPDRPYYIEGFAYFSYMFSTEIHLTGTR